MVRVAGGKLDSGLTIPDYFIDRFEVTNAMTARSTRPRRSIAITPYSGREISGAPSTTSIPGTTWIVNGWHITD
jgi:hypothetical protein